MHKMYALYKVKFTASIKYNLGLSKFFVHQCKVAIDLFDTKNKMLQQFEGKK